MNNHPKKLLRLASVFQSYEHPVYFITFNTHLRRALLDRDEVHARFKRFAEKSPERGIAVGRYVIMPDHIHFFIRIAPDLKLGTTIQMLKRSLSASIEESPPHWQPGFFDHLLRHRESYSEKWQYVLQNPVRAGLVTAPEDWPYQGEIGSIYY